MAFFAWVESYHTGIQRIDDQHRQLVSILNRLYESAQIGRANDVLSGLLDELIRYADTHFVLEEELMRSSGFEELEAHRREHLALRERVVAFKESFDAGNMGLALEAGKFLKEWLSHHILTVDMQYKEHLLSRGVR